ncbi:hypothetical protein [Pelotomaculum propionicicum]|uniref:Uncharacterized protein n=1 Tax=Pelotomaculum propionicicum TaxID=258475 RepID=A0A4Y7RT37_9FIRM|nr:hypothetical protein [Pelotomaculum propionicicum]NLI13036.1 hypothetical protein [Peptococcaceae bacterium]TEB11916.1 hypothetical protein Pmgp_01283 [Pelotomaculum propionicicum]
MRRFVIFTPGCTEEDLKVWEDAGFKLVDETSLDYPELRPDVIFICDFKAGVITWQLISKLLPKVLILTGSSEQTPVIPGELADLFNLQVIKGENISFTIGSTIQGQVVTPAWEIYRVSDGPLTPQEQLQALADSIYRFLLQDVFKETAEWCGHMSSVVGPM